MASGTVFYVGTDSEVAHHAAPLMGRLPIRIATAEEVLKLAVPGDLAIFFSEHFERFRSAIRQLQSRRVATLYAIDGILEWRNAWENRADEPASPWTMRPVLSDKVACIGAAQARVLWSWGNADKIEIVGIPRFDDLAARDTTRNLPRDPNVFRILVMTARCPGFTDSQRQQIAQSLADLCDTVRDTDRLDGRRIEIAWRLKGGMDRRIGVENQESDSDLADVLDRVDATITTPSTAQLESMLLGKPTAILDYTNSPLYADAAWRITAKEQIAQTLEQLIRPTEARMHYQKSVLHDALQLQSPASDLMVQLIQAMLGQAQSAVRSDRTPRFPKAILPPADAAPPSLCLPAAYPMRGVFQNDDLQKLQTQLADAERETELLHRMIDGLRDELGQAHAIFDSIHRHPVAGPVVRARQKVIDWFAKAERGDAEHDS
ncbi:hypothetical protein Poly24_52460 [Rosistilla carotiformis]|uniref:Uncharacterized protein n=1 Tax=Rosistilla carotiformis TaxID=2528017 RepID=A0A518K142_9BACT|nr:hypothetical protein [Rosistilla carotiformis]QDV71509.1 hypothetical protein Poly24_52460 [Rosistilla carotiformis]